MTSSCDDLLSKLDRPEAKSKLATLFGQVKNFKVNNQIDQVFEDSLSLWKKRKLMPSEKIAIKCIEIQSELARIRHQNALSIPNRRFIRIAAYILNMLQLFPSSKTTDVLHNCAHNAYLRKDQDMLPESEPRPPLVDADSWESAEFAFDLCEMAHFFYQNKINEGMKKLHQLTPSQKNRLEEICISSDAELPSHFCVEDVKELQHV